MKNGRDGLHQRKKARRREARRETEQALEQHLEDVREGLQELLWLEEELGLWDDDRGLSVVSEADYLSDYDYDYEYEYRDSSFPRAPVGGVCKGPEGPGDQLSE